MSDLLPGTCADLRGGWRERFWAGTVTEAGRTVETSRKLSPLVSAPQWSSEPPTPEARQNTRKPTVGHVEVGEPILRHVGKQPQSEDFS